jgi:hypothetical protein
MTTYYYSTVKNNTGSTIALLFVVPEHHWHTIEWVSDCTTDEREETIDVADKLADIIYIFRNQTQTHTLSSIVYNWLYHYKAGNHITLKTFTAATENILTSIKQVTNLHSNKVAYGTH